MKAMLKFHKKEHLSLNHDLQCLGFHDLRSKCFKLFQMIIVHLAMNDLIMMKNADSFVMKS